MKKYFLQKKWFRNLSNNDTFIYVNEKWKELSKFVKGEKIEKVDGKWSTLAYCKCGNELVHSDSFLREREVQKTGMAVYDYECSHCGEVQYRNPCLMPGIHPCNIDGILL